MGTALDRRRLISRNGLRGGALYWDAQVELPERLVVDALRAAEDAGATIRNHVAATELHTSNRGVDGLELTALTDGGTASVCTTEVDIDGDPGDARVTPEEVRYLHVAVRSLFPGVEVAPTWASVGVRSLFRSERAASRVSRRHLLVDHGDDGVHGLVTVAGGKLTASRSIAAEVVDEVLRERDHGATHPDRAIGPPVAPAPAATDATSRRLWRLYGRRAAEVTEWTERDPWWAEPLVPGGDAIRAEVAHAIEREWARTLGDVVLRRLALGSGPDLGGDAAAAAGEVAVARLGWDRQRVDRDLAGLEVENAERRLPPAD